jgi:hypothetical protein
MNTEPVAVAAAARLVLVAVAAFGVGFTAGQIVAVAAAVEAVLALIVRKRVTPS